MFLEYRNGMRAWCTDFSADDVTLTGAEARHLAGARRAEPGARVELLDGRGGLAVAEVMAAERGSVRLRVIERRREPAPSPHVILVQALPKGQKLDWILQKAVELGVAEIAPVATAHCEAKIVPGRDKQGRREQILIEAAKQSGNPWCPVLHPPRPLADFLAAPPACDVWARGGAAGGGGAAAGLPAGARFGGHLHRPGRGTSPRRKWRACSRSAQSRCRSGRTCCARKPRRCTPWACCATADRHGAAFEIRDA